MKKIIVLFLILFFAMQTSAQEKSDSTKMLNDVVVKETYQVTAEEEKIPFMLNADFSGIIKIPEGIQWNSVASNSGTTLQDDWESFHFNLSHPELANIHPQPVKVFHAQFSDLKEWLFTIHEGDGSLFRTISGHNNPPVMIPWDGIGDRGSFLIPGQNYTFNFTATDRAGNKRTFPGETLSVPAYYMISGDSLFVGIACAKLFSSDGLALAQQAKDYALELAGLIKYFSVKGNISFECSHPKTDEFIGLLSEQLNMERTVFYHKQSYKKNQEFIGFWVED